MNPPEHGLCVIISGTPSTGFTVVGPFKHPAIASEWGNAWEEDIDWWVVELVDPAAREPQPNQQFTHAERQHLEAQNAALIINRIGHKPKE